MTNIEILKYVNDNSEYVSINNEKIGQFLDNIKDWTYNYWLDKETVDLTEKELIILAFICESMNFCFWSKRD